jgi:tetratricopeptide (TPR) repeat protein
VRQPTTGKPEPGRGTRRPEPAERLERVDADSAPSAPVRRPEGPRRPALPPEVRDEVAAEVGGHRAAKVEAALAEALRAFDRDRYRDAKQILSDVARRAPGAPAVRELLGLTLYRLGEWKAAIVELEAFRALTNSADQLPVLADCYRALRRYDMADELWTELKAASPHPEVMAEGRIVAAGVRSDQGDLRGAIAILAASEGTVPKKVQRWHLRQWYALADLYERAGDVPRARRLFALVREQDAAFAADADRVRGR